MNIYEINTTAYDEENFFIQTTLSKKEIIKVIGPMVKKERDDGTMYANDEYVHAIAKAYPSAQVFFHESFELISL